MRARVENATQILILTPTVMAEVSGHSNILNSSSFEACTSGTVWKKVTVHSPVFLVTLAPRTRELEAIRMRGRYISQGPVA